MFTTFPVRQILEESQYMKSEKKLIFRGFYNGFHTLQIKSTLERFVSKKDCKDRLLYILFYSEISRVEGTALVEKFLLTQDISDIISYYKGV